MVEETKLGKSIVFKCEKCGWLYKDLETAEECQQWCEKHDYCSLKYQRNAIKF